MAHSGCGGSLRVVETDTGNPIADFTHVQLTITCVKWSHGRHFVPQSMSDHSPRKKRKRKSEVAVNDLGLIAMGTTSGAIFLYSFYEGKLHTKLEKGHTAEITDLCWYPNNRTLCSSSLDGHVVEWDVPSSQMKQKWKASDSGVHSLCLCGSDRLLTAGTAIKVWSLQTRKVIQKFTGHATEVFRLLPVPSSGAEDGQSDGSYFVSAAANDKIINAWVCHPGSREKNPVASFSVTEQPAELTLQVTGDQMLILSVLTAKGQVQVFEHTLNGKLLKPVKPTTVVHAVTEGSRDQVPVSVPLLAALPSTVGSPSASLLLAHGSLVTPQFSSVALRPKRSEIPVVVSSKPGKKSKKEDSSPGKRARVEGSTVLPSTEPGSSKPKRKKSELTLTERLEAQDGPPSSSQKSVSGRPLTSDQLGEKLTAALQSNDPTMLTAVFQEQNDTKIRNVIRNLPPPQVDGLVKEVAKRCQGRPSGGLLVTHWLKQILMARMDYIDTVPELRQTVASLKRYFLERQQFWPARLEVKGKIDALLARIAANQSQEDEPSPSSEDFLPYQDDSDSGEEMNLIEFGASESEGNWEDSDID
ncbi:hypothetical protein ACOMHN_058684 [Nucella lapillus]